MSFSSILELFGIKLPKSSNVKTSDEQCICTPSKPFYTYKKIVDNVEYTIKGEKIFSFWDNYGYSDYGLEIYILSDSKNYLLYTERYDDGIIKIFEDFNDLKIRLKGLVDGNFGFLTYTSEHFRMKFKRALKLKDLYVIRTTELS